MPTHTRWSFENREEGILYLGRRLIEILSCARPSLGANFFLIAIFVERIASFFSFPPKPSREIKKLQCQLCARSGRETPPSLDRRRIPLLAIEFADENPPLGAKINVTNRRNRAFRSDVPRLTGRKKRNEKNKDNRGRGRGGGGTLEGVEFSRALFDSPATRDPQPTVPEVYR